MSDRAGMICDADERRARRSPRRAALNADIRAKGIACGRPAEAVRALQWQQMALASEAVLAALDHFIRHGGGSRGARAIRDPAGEALPLTARRTARGLSLPGRARRRPRPSRSSCAWTATPSTSRRDRTGRSTRAPRSFFERDWPDWLTGRIFDLDKGEEDECLSFRQRAFSPSARR